MNCQVKQGSVCEVTNFSKRQELLVAFGQKQEKAINYPEITGDCSIGDEVIVNTTAVALNLGTGGYHFVMAIVGHEQNLLGAGHIIKLRYTPSQIKTLSVEEPDSEYHQTMSEASSLDGLPVLVGSLHSMLGPVCIGFNKLATNKKIVYLMSDGAALPIGFSRLVESLKNANLLQETITFGNAFGGDYEAVNVFSALLAAKHVCRADAAVILMGPGVVGTNTPWGTTALEQGIYLNAIESLNGNPIGLLRMSFADSRERHQGVSHHTMTSLTKITQVVCQIPIPIVAKSKTKIKNQLKQLEKHQLHWIDTESYFDFLLSSNIDLKSMGKTPNEDLFFFSSALAAGILAAHFVNRHTTHLK